MASENLLFLGKPGSGKGTLSEILQKVHGYVALSTGNLLRQEATQDTPEGREIKELLKTGDFASDDLIFKLVFKFLEENSRKRVIFDGFPRNLTQLEACFDRGIVFSNIFLVDASDELVKQRIVNRRVHVPSGRVYNVLTKPPKTEGLDDLTGEPLTHRDDDKEETVERRLSVYRQLTEPILNALHTHGCTAHVVDGGAPLVEQIDSMTKRMV